MKRLSLLLNIVLALAVVALYILHFTGIGAGRKSSSEAFNGSRKCGRKQYFLCTDRFGNQQFRYGK